jgi:hypothetical protein
MGDSFMSVLPFAAQAVGGIAQSIIGGINARKQQKKLMGMIDNTPKYEANKSIMDYYGQALSRYGVSPTESALYKQQMQGINRNVANAVGATQDRRGGLAGVSSILRGANDATLSANVAAEQQRDRRFNELGQATNMRSQEEQKAWQQNTMLPFELKYNLTSQRAGAANQMANAGLQNIFGALQNWGISQSMSKGQ